MSFHCVIFISVFNDRPVTVLLLLCDQCVEKVKKPVNRMLRELCEHVCNMLELCMNILCTFCAHIHSKLAVEVSWNELINKRVSVSKHCSYNKLHIVSRLGKSLECLSYLARWWQTNVQLRFHYFEHTNESRTDSRNWYVQFIRIFKP